MEEKPKRRWFQFRLRTLFVLMTVVAVWFGWQASIVHERTNLLAIARERGAWISETDENQLGLIRRVMGDWSVYGIVLGDYYHFSDEFEAHLRRAFPEANIGRFEPPYH